MNEVDAIRIEQFRQFKKEIRGSREYEVVGIDVAKEKHHAFFGTATGKTLLRNLVIGNCVFRGKWPPVPGQSVHLFRV